MKKLKEKKFNSITDIYIVGILYLIILLYNSLKDLSEIFTYGILKKEILTKGSNIGFDIKIKMK